jgi:hypothetical protein
MISIDADVVKLERKRIKGRTRIRCNSGVEKDVKNLGMDNWKQRHKKVIIGECFESGSRPQ